MNTQNFANVQCTTCTTLHRALMVQVKNCSFAPHRTVCLRTRCVVQTAVHQKTLSKQKKAHSFEEALE
jgi:hypothetical protein